MYKKLLCVFLVFTVLICTFSACSDDEGLTVFYPIASDPDCLDPQIAESDEAVIITRNCMEGLVRLGEDGEILPGVAESWDISSDGKTYVFHIRDDAKWQKLNSHEEILGEGFEDTFDYSVTADDCAFGIIRALRPETKAEDAYMLFCIQNAASVHGGILGEENLGVHASGNTLTITLERSNPDFIRMLTYPMCMPCKRAFFNATGAKYGLELKYTLCNGPFYVGNWVEDSTVTLYKSDTYSGSSKPRVSTMYFNVNGDDEQIVEKFNKEDYNSIPVEASYIDEIKSDDDIVYAKQKNIISGLAFNTADSILSNEKIRKALIFATDLSSFDDDKEFAPGIVPPSCRWGGKSYRASAGAAQKPEPNNENAMIYYFDGLQELEISNASISILCTEKRRNDIVRIIQNWEKLFGFSIIVTTKVMEEDEISDAIAKGEYQIALTSLEAEDGSAVKFLQNFCTDNENNIFAFSDESYDGQIQKCLYFYEGDSILSGLRAAEQYLIANGIFYPLYESETCFAYRDEILNPYIISNVADIDFSARENSDE